MKKLFIPERVREIVPHRVIEFSKIGRLDCIKEDYLFFSFLSFQIFYAYSYAHFVYAWKWLEVKQWKRTMTIYERKWKRKYLYEIDFRNYYWINVRINNSSIEKLIQGWYWFISTGSNPFPSPFLQLLLSKHKFSKINVRSLIFVASFLSYFFFFFCIYIFDNKFRKLGVKGSDLDSFSVLIFPEKQVNCGNF